MLAWVIAGVAVILAWAAWARASRVKRKLEALNQSYWELRYDYTRLRSQVARLDPDSSDNALEPGTGSAHSAESPAAGPSVSFVPLSAIRKKDR
jgi:hypothetical protein